jgi:hypothetical protein
LGVKVVLANETMIVSGNGDIRKQKCANWQLGLLKACHI